ncbi:MAG: thiamine phosphate synthase [Peptoniphilus sp.]|nr:thiamine phosphate synthase [Peptoniphilus sp.]MDD7363045.1 thiamine phosphate synthase [Bacillota bacterium]MDY6045310.1 thiamine phosphate synthase [Peptoniphilus sp.]
MKSLYFVTNSEAFEREDDFFASVDSALEGGIDYLQLREKNRTDAEVYRLAMRLKEKADAHGTTFIVDDRIDVAKAVGCGVHLGRDDLPVSVAREILGEDAVIGASVKSVERAKEAEREGADYFGTGALFHTNTKVITKRTSPEMFRAIKETVRVPVFAIGGINRKTLPKLAGLPMDGICVVSAIQYAEDPKRAVLELREMLNRL